ncbi:LOW QUALITY PROTEIN: Glycine N-phenylacetyltransferase, partial [Galemys pyrenaicus]
RRALHWFEQLLSRLSVISRSKLVSARMGSGVRRHQETLPDGCPPTRASENLGFGLRVSRLVLCLPPLRTAPRSKARRPLTEARICPRSAGGRRSGTPESCGEEVVPSRLTLSFSALARRSALTAPKRLTARVAAGRRGCDWAPESKERKSGGGVGGAVGGLGAGTQEAGTLGGGGRRQGYLVAGAQGHRKLDRGGGGGGAGWLGRAKAGTREGGGAGGQGARRRVASEVGAPGGRGARSEGAWQTASLSQRLTATELPGTSWQPQERCRENTPLVRCAGNRSAIAATQEPTHRAHPLHPLQTYFSHRRSGRGRWVVPGCRKEGVAPGAQLSCCRVSDCGRTIFSLDGAEAPGPVLWLPSPQETCERTLALAEGGRRLGAIQWDSEPPANEPTSLRDWRLEGDPPAARKDAGGCVPELWHKPTATERQCSRGLLSYLEKLWGQRPASTVPSSPPSPTPPWHAAMSLQDPPPPSRDHRASSGGSGRVEFRLWPAGVDKANLKEPGGEQGGGEEPMRIDFGDSQSQRAMRKLADKVASDSPGQPEVKDSFAPMSPSQLLAKALGLECQRPDYLMPPGQQFREASSDKDKTATASRSPYGTGGHIGSADTLTRHQLEHIDFLSSANVKVPARMLQLQGRQMLRMLEKSLRESLPESLKVRTDTSDKKAPLKGWKGELSWCPGAEPGTGHLQLTQLPPRPGRQLCDILRPREKWRSGGNDPSYKALAVRYCCKLDALLDTRPDSQGRLCPPSLPSQLTRPFPGVLQVYGTVFHMNQGNPFNLKALVDKWPDFGTVVVRPQEQEMTDNFDHYTNTYQIYSKDPKNCQEFLSTSDVINWEQHLQIQSKCRVWGACQLRLSHLCLQVNFLPRALFPTTFPFSCQTLDNELVTPLFPGVLQVYGTVFHMNQGNPFNLKALVDKWPDFSTVLVRPQEQVRRQRRPEHLCARPCYVARAPGGRAVVNVWARYHIPEQRMCGSPSGGPVISSSTETTAEVSDPWAVPESCTCLILCAQSLGSQSSLNKDIHNLAAAKSLQVTHSQNILYMWAETARKLVPSLVDVKVLAPTGGKPKAMTMLLSWNLHSDEALFRPSSLNVAHAALVNEFWSFGGNEKSLRFIERCIRTFPSICLLGPEGTPVSWALMDQTGELRMAATVPKYRARGLIAQLMYNQSQALNKLGFPIYSHVDKRNKIMQKVQLSLHFIPLPCDWNQWHCVKVPAKMLQLQGRQMLRMLEKSLRESLPESLKVYGTVFHMNQGNPFNLKALVDKWPDFGTVVVRPQEQEMTDNFDHYTNTYQIYSKDPKNCQEFLSTSDVINWEQHLQIQSSQSSLREAIESVAAAKSVKVKLTQCLLYMTPKTAKELLPSLGATKNLALVSGEPKSIDQEMFKFSSLDMAHAALVNEFWGFGGNERSLRFIERCIRTFPSICLLGPEGTPVSWALMDQTGEMRMGATVPKYRVQGLITHVIYAYVQNLEKLAFPVYGHTARTNKIMQKMSDTLHHIPMPCDWNQWHLTPLFPGVLQVYGTVFHMNQGNPFNLKALVDKWPDFSTVLVRPQEQVRRQRRPEHLCARPCYVARAPGNILYMWVETVKKLVPSLLDRKVLDPAGGKPRAIDEALFQPSSLDVAHAALVNEFWLFGGNEKSLRFIERCIRTFPSFCLLGPEGTPVSWGLMDHTGELRMGATMPKYRAHGLISQLMYTQSQSLSDLVFPVYIHIKGTKLHSEYTLICITSPCPVTGTRGTVSLCDSPGLQCRVLGPCLGCERVGRET